MFRIQDILTTYTAYRSGEKLFYRIFSKLRAKDATGGLDACFSGYSASGLLFKNISPGMLKSKRPVREMVNGSVFCGAGKDQVSTWCPAKRHSLFTYFFLKGIGGVADWLKLDFG